MSKNDTIRKSDKKFIRTEKARIRRQFSDSKKQEEMIAELYKRFIKIEPPKNVEVKGSKKENTRTPEKLEKVEKPAKKSKSD